MIFGALLKLIVVFVASMILIVICLFKIERERSIRSRKLQILRQMKYSSNFSLYDRNIYEDPKMERGIYELFKQSDSTISGKLTFLERKKK